MQNVIRNKMNEQLNRLITLFLQKVLLAEKIMKEKHNVEQPMYWRQNDIPRVGVIDQYSYEFHGIGCCFDFGELAVDYDYGDQGRVDGFDLWRLTIFGEQINDFQNYIESGEITSDFNSCIKTGEIMQSGDEYDNLFYLSKSV